MAVGNDDLDAGRVDPYRVTTGGSGPGEARILEALHDRPGGLLANHDFSLVD